MRSGVHLILRVITYLIVAYRRWLAGRGPLRRVRCSFALEDSCSTFGLRTAQTASSWRQAIARIARRLRRCREACLVRDGRSLQWATIHDRPPVELIAEMRRDGEPEAAIARMLVTRRAVAFHVGDDAAARECVGALPGTPRVVVRPTRTRTWRRRIVLVAFLALAPLVGLRGLWR
jgi:hypothetical protein